MTVPTNTFQAASGVGIREDLADIIYRIDPTDTPFTSNIGRSKATNTRHDWQTQALASSVDTNANIQGDDASTDAVTPTVRVWNYTQIADKVARVDGTIEVVDKAGRDSEMEYQVLLKGLELKRDVEKQMLSNKASVLATTAAAGQSAGMESWLTSNVSRGGTAASGGFSSTTGLVAAPTDALSASTRAFTEALLKTVVASAWANGGKPNQIYMRAGAKQAFSGFTGIAQIRKEAPGQKQAVVIGAAEVYVSDFGNLAAIPSIQSRARTALVVDPKMVKMATLRPMKNWPLAKTGDSEQRQILIEYCLEVNHEAAHGVVADLNYTT